MYSKLKGVYLKLQHISLHKKIVKCSVVLYIFIYHFVLCLLSRVYDCNAFIFQINPSPVQIVFLYAEGFPKFVSPVI